MASPTLISNPDEITSSWLTEVIQASGIDGEVASFVSESIGTGQVGENVRFTLSGSENLPKTIVGKFPSPDPVSRQAGIAQLTYVREVFFYQNIQDTVAIQTPKVFFTDVDNETHDFVIMMEDLAPGVQGDQLKGCDVEDGRLALTQLAHLHGPRWGDESLSANELLSNRNEDSENLLKVFYDTVSPGFLARYNSRLTAEEKEMVSLVSDNLVAYANNYRGDATLIHIDYRLDNMMFGGPYPLTVVDWQSLALGCALNDTSYFLGTSLIEEDRQQHEEELVRAYYDELSTYDINLSWEECWKYYRHHAPAGLIMAVIASMIVGETERGNDMFMAMAKRSCRMCRDLDSIEVIRQP